MERHEHLEPDPSFKGTPTGTALEEIGRRYGVEVRWHQGFALKADAVDAVFRGPAMPALARRLAPAGGTIDCALVGDAVRSLRADPEAWSDWGSEAVTLQHLKQLWHVLVRFGGPR